MNDFIKTLLSLSLSGSIIALIVFFLKPILRHRVPKWIQYYMWVVILLRLILPLSFPGSVMNEVFSRESYLNAGVNYTSFSNSINLDTKDLPVYTSPMEQNVYNNTVNKNSFYLPQKYIILVWFLGLMITLMINLLGYVKFIRFVNKTNIPAKSEEVSTLFKFSKKNGIQLYRNPFISTPMLIGVVKPRIIIPAIDFNQKQLDNILLHELTHLRRFDIVIKWLTMFSVAFHWFNPVVYLIKKEINNACELACDEGVIKNLSNKDKQSYGDTLIYVVSEYKEAHLGVLQAKMYEEKKTLKERLTSIMKYNKKSKIFIFLSVVLLVSIVMGGLILGAFNGKTDIINKVENEIENKYEIYKNDKYGFSLNIPKDFYQHINIDENKEENIIYFRYKEISKDYPLMGHVGRIEVYSKDQYRTKEDFKDRENMYSLKILGESDRFYFGSAHATDLQVPYEKNELLENFRKLETDFDSVIKSMMIYDVKRESDEKGEDILNKDTSVSEYSLVADNKVIPLGSWDINVEDILGKPARQNTEILGHGSDTFEGSYLKSMKYDSIEITLFSPKENGKSFWIMKMDVKDNSIKTWDGISVGSSLKDVKAAYSNLKVFPDGRTDINNCGYIVENLVEYKYMKFEVKDGKVEELSLYIEMP